VSLYIFGHALSTTHFHGYVDSF